MVVAMGNPFDLPAMDAVSAATGQSVLPVVVLPDELGKLIKTHLGVGAETVEGLMAQQTDRQDGVELLEEVEWDRSEASEMAQEPSVVRLVNEIDRREHHLFMNEQGRYELVDIEEVPKVAGGAVKAWIFQRSAAPDDTCVLVWAERGSVKLRLPVKGLTAMRPWGVALPSQSDADGTCVLVGSRTYVVLPRTSRSAASQLLQLARVL